MPHHSAVDFGQQGGCRDDHARHAEAALDCTSFDESLLHRRKPSVAIETLDRHNACRSRACETEARTGRKPVNQHGTTAADALITASFCSGQAKLSTKHLKQGLVALNVMRDCRPFTLRTALVMCRPRSELTIALDCPAKKVWKQGAPITGRCTHVVDRIRAVAKMGCRPAIAASSHFVPKSVDRLRRTKAATARARLPIAKPAYKSRRLEGSSDAERSDRIVAVDPRKFQIMPADLACTGAKISAVTISSASNTVVK